MPTRVFFNLTAFGVATALLGCGSDSGTSTDTGPGTVDTRSASDLAGTTTAMDDGTAVDEGTGLPDGCEVAATIASIEAIYFKASCALSSCHSDAGSGRPAGGLVLLEGRSYEQLVGKDSTQFPGNTLVVAGDPDASFIVKKVKGTHDSSHGTIMPPGVLQPIDPACRIKQLRAWIAAGAPDTP